MALSSQVVIAADRNERTQLGNIAGALLHECDRHGYVTFVANGRSVQLAEVNSNPIEHLLRRAAHLMTNGFGVRLAEKPYSGFSHNGVKQGSPAQRRQARLLAKDLNDDPQLALVTSELAVKPLPEALRNVLKNALGAIAAGKSLEVETITPILDRKAFTEISGLNPETMRALSDAGILKGTAGTGAYSLADAVAWQKYTESRQTSQRETGGLGF